MSLQDPIVFVNKFETNSVRNLVANSFFIHRLWQATHSIDSECTLYTRTGYLQTGRRTRTMTSSARAKRAKNILKAGLLIGRESEHVYRVQSQTKRAIIYTVHISRVPTCTCPDFLLKKHICKHMLACIFDEMEEGTVSLDLLRHVKQHRPGVSDVIMSTVETSVDNESSFIEDDHVRSRRPYSTPVCCILLEEIKDLDEDGFYCDLCGAVFCRGAVDKLFTLKAILSCPFVGVDCILDLCGCRRLYLI
jgi:hypothetical protein